MKKFIVVALSLVLSQTLFAKESSPVSLTTKSYKEVVKISKNGEKRVTLVDASKVIPGDVVVYKNIVTNSSNTKAKDLVLNNSIPKHTEYVANSAKCEKGCDTLFSVDNGKSFKHADKLYIKKGGKKRLAMPKEYTNVRWVLTSALDANAKTYVSFKTRLK